MLIANIHSRQTAHLIKGIGIAIAIRYAAEQSAYCRIRTALIGHLRFKAAFAKGTLNVFCRLQGISGSASICYGQSFR